MADVVRAVIEIQDIHKKYLFGLMPLGPDIIGTRDILIADTFLVNHSSFSYINTHNTLPLIRTIGPGDLSERKHRTVINTADILPEPGALRVLLSVKAATILGVELGPHRRR